MRIFKTKWLARFVRREGIADKSLREAIERAERGLVDADLGGGREQKRWLHTCLQVFLNPSAKGAKGRRAPLRQEGERIGLKTWVAARWELGTIGRRG